METANTYNYKVVSQFAIMTVVWGIVGMAVGVLIAAQLVFSPATRRVDTPARAGLGSLLASMTQEGAGDRSGSEFAEAVSALGGTLGASSDRESLTFSVRVLARNLDPAIGLLADAALRPRMDGADFGRLKQRRLDEIRQMQNRPTVIAGNVASRMLLGPRNPYAWPQSGTHETVSALTLDDVRSLQSRLIRPGSATLPCWPGSRRSPSGREGGRSRSSGGPPRPRPSRSRTRTGSSSASAPPD